MRQERGWTEDTISGCCGTVDRFSFRLERRRIALADVRDRAILVVLIAYCLRSGEVADIELCGLT